MADRRTSPRTEFNVQMEVRRNGDVFQGTSINVSETGMLIETNKRLNFGERVTIHFVLPSGKRISGTGIVVRQQDFEWGASGYAVHWELTDEQKRMLTEIINEE